MMDQRVNMDQKRRAQSIKKNIYDKEVSANVHVLTST